MRPTRRRALPVLAALGMLVPALASAPALAADTARAGTAYTWVGASNDSGGNNVDWTDPANWSPAGVPGDGDSVVVRPPGPNHCAVNLGKIPQVSLVDVTVGPTNGIACEPKLTGGPITVTGSMTWGTGRINGDLVVADGATAALSPQSGSGGASTLVHEMNGDLTVLGTLRLEDVSGNHLLKLVAPHRLTIEDTGALVSTGSSRIGFSACCVDPARVHNDGAIRVESGELVVDSVAVDHVGVLDIATGAAMTVLGNTATNVWGPAAYTGGGRLDLAGTTVSELQGANTLGPGFTVGIGRAGFADNPRLGGDGSVTGDGTVEWLAGTLRGDLTFGRGVRVDATGEDLRIGDGSDTRVTVGDVFDVASEGGLRIRKALVRVQKDGLLALGATGGVDGSDGGRISSAGYTLLGAAGLALGDGYVQKNGLTVLSEGTVLDPGPGFVLERGDLNGTGTVDGRLTVVGGTVNPGLDGDPASMTVTGRLVLKRDATVLLDHHSTGHDRLLVGSAKLGGTLRSVNAAGWTPAKGDRATVLVALGDRTGTFGCTTTKGKAGSWGPDYTRSKVKLVWSKRSAGRC